MKGNGRQDGTVPSVASTLTVVAPSSPAARSTGALGTLLSAGATFAERFEVLDHATAGGMGSIYRALDRLTGKEVALKTVNAGTMSDAEERFGREARVLCELSHPAIVRYVAHGRANDGALYLAMEWLDGHDLGTRLATDPLTIAESVAVARRVAAALAHAHGHGVMHRDIKPRNVFLPGGDVTRTTLIDFGIARVQNATTQLTGTGGAIGTPGYMAPEQAQGTGRLDARVDVFALGCVLYECLTGTAAFVGQNLLALLAKILLEEQPRARTLNDRVPADLDDLVAAMMSKAPEERPRDGTALLAALEALGPLPDAKPVPAGAPPKSITGGEQRLLSVIIAGDPHRVDLGDGLTAATWNRAEKHAILDVVAPYEARAERLADGTLLATLAGLGDAADQASRAARCAWALAQHLGDVPVALATGRGNTGRHLPTGAVIDQVCALLRSAVVQNAVGPTVLLDGATAKLLDGRFEIRPIGARHELRGIREGIEPPATLLGRPTKCVGRTRELLTLEATFAECVEESVARVALVTAPAGMGKSRLRHELVRRVRRSHPNVEIWIGQGDSLRAGAPFAILAQAVSRAAGMADAEPLNVRQQKLRQRIAQSVTPEDVARVSEFIGELVGAPFPEEGSVQLRAARQDAVLRGDQMRRAFEDWIDAEARRHPLVLVLEDMQWGDLPTVKLIDALLRHVAQRPVLVLALARPEVHEAFPALWEHRGVSELRLSGLTPRASTELVREVLGDALSEERAAKIVERAGGNAFWLEELIRSEAEGRGDQLPDTLVLMAQSRIERLDDQSRRVLRAASVFGQRFWRGAVRSLLGDASETGAVDRVLSLLEEREVIVAASSSRFPGEDQLEFRHALLRDAAYGMLTDKDRVLGHRLAAEWLEAAGEIDALTMAEHFERGEQAERAVSWFLRAGRQALEGNDHAAALSRAEKAVALGAAAEQLGEVRLLAAEAHKWRGENADAARAAAEAFELLPRGSTEWALAAGELAAAHGKLGERDALAALARNLGDVEASAGAVAIAVARCATQLVLSGSLSLADQLLARLSAAREPGPAVSAWMCEARAVREQAAGNPAARLRLAEAAAESFEQAGDLRNACLQRISVGFACVEIGATADAEAALKEALAVSERMGLVNSTPVASAQLARALAARGETDEAIALLEGTVREMERQENHRFAGIARGYLGPLLLQRGDVEGAERALRRALMALAAAPPLACSVHARLAQVLLARGDATTAVEEAKRGMVALERNVDAAFGESLVRLTYAQALLAAGRHDDARAVVDAALERLRVRAATLDDDASRRAAFENMPENRALEALAAELAPPP